MQSNSDRTALQMRTCCKQHCNTKSFKFVEKREMKKIILISLLLAGVAHAKMEECHTICKETIGGVTQCYNSCEYSEGNY
jgi:hypothetical protein